LRVCTGTVTLVTGGRGGGGGRAGLEMGGRLQLLYSTAYVSRKISNLDRRIADRPRGTYAYALI